MMHLPLFMHASKTNYRLYHTPVKMKSTLLIARVLSSLLSFLQPEQFLHEFLLCISFVCIKADTVFNDLPDRARRPLISWLATGEHDIQEDPHCIDV